MFDASLEGLKRVSDIVKNLREFARLDESDFDTIRIGDTIRSALSMMQHVFDEKQLNLTFDEESNPSLQCRPAAITQVFHNVLMNAIQACDCGDQITIRVAGDNEAPVIEIIDTGAGIAAEDLPKIFEPFFTTRPIGEGTGLGLSLCYGVVRDHGGEIDVTSDLGEVAHTYSMSDSS